MYNCFHIKHNKSKHHQSKADGKRPLVSAMKAQLEMDGSDQNSRDSSNLSLNRASGSKLPLNSPDNTDGQFICPGCRKDSPGSCCTSRTTHASPRCATKSKIELTHALCNFSLPSLTTACLYQADDLKNVPWRVMYFVNRSDDPHYGRLQ